MPITPKAGSLFHADLQAAPALLVMAVALAALAGLGFTVFRGSTWFGAFAAFVAFLAVLPFALSLMFPAFMGAMWAGAATQPTLAIGLVLLIGLMLMSLNLASVAAKFVAVLVFAPLALGVGITLVGGVDAFTKPTIEQPTYSARIGQWTESVPLYRNCFRFTAVQHAVPVRARFVDRNNRFDEQVVAGFPAEIRPTPGFYAVAVAFQASENHSLLMTPNRPVRIVHGTILNIPDGEYARIAQAPDPAAAQSDYCARMAQRYRALLRRR